MNVYISMKEFNNKSFEILGVFAEKSSAIECCLNQSTFSYQEWEQEDDSTWTNGSGLRVKVSKYCLQ
jgi:hypothetical protein